jgi:hypothetical protein
LSGGLLAPFLVLFAVMFVEVIEEIRLFQLLLVEGASIHSLFLA